MRRDKIVKVGCDIMCYGLCQSLRLLAGAIDIVNRCLWRVQSKTKIYRVSQTNVCRNVVIRIIIKNGRKCGENGK